MIIEDGTGSGHKAKVNDEYELETRAQTTGRAEWENHNHERAYAMYFSQAAANSGANECLGYIKNTADLDLVIDEISIHATAADTIYVSKVTGTAAGGSSITPTNANVGSGLTATVTTMQHTAITGLTDGGRLMNFYLAANGFVVREPKATIIIKKNSAIAIYTTTNQANTLKVNIWFHFEDIH
jgi:hypothetical protein